MAYSADEFWLFSEDFYSREGVERACLSLQNRRGLDVNIALVCFWLAAKHVELVGPMFGEMDSAVSNWRDTIVRSLQQCRKQLPRFVGRMSDEHRNSVKRAIKTAELEAERASQAKIVETLNKFPLRATNAQPKELAAVALRVYLRRFTPSPDQQDKADIDVLVGAL
jgi:uncharacterized protein (TIGR02444 family)